MKKSSCEAIELMLYEGFQNGDLEMDDLDEALAMLESKKNDEAVDTLKKMKKEFPSLEDDFDDFIEKIKDSDCGECKKKDDKGDDDEEDGDETTEAVDNQYNATRLHIFESAHNGEISEEERDDLLRKLNEKYDSIMESGSADTEEDDYDDYDDYEDYEESVQDDSDLRLEIYESCQRGEISEEDVDELLSMLD